MMTWAGMGFGLVLFGNCGSLNNLGKGYCKDDRRLQRHPDGIIGPLGVTECAPLGSRQAGDPSRHESV